ncbi:EamA family transporter [Lachnoclostridium sp. An14]|uniref:DMT family transporter n=1 Tax=Lachnoclostridium sp. An14 TaxID=1965562 RepID=UPI000B36CDF3|nr:DMT family transporter [Lachnoclostridium sp. An14]OUQ21106.1 EamA family transporter [Lachnoclostridium sp. An14]
MNHHGKARLLMTASMAIFGTLGLFTRNITVSSGELALYRAILAAVLIALYLLAARQPIRLAQIRGELPLLLLSGVAMGINWILLFQAYRYTTISMATLSYYFAPVIVTAVSPVLFRERMTKKQLLCFLLSTAGLVLIIGAGETGGSGTDLTGILFGLGAAVFYAAVILLNKRIRQVAGIHRTFLQLVAAAVILLPYVALTGGSSLGSLSALGFGCLLVVGLIHTGITYCMYFTALRDLSGQEAAILSYIDPLVAALVSVALLGEAMTLWQAVGGAMILGFTLVNELGGEG